jgi:hypothetical protein
MAKPRDIFERVLTRPEALAAGRAARGATEHGSEAWLARGPFKRGDIVIVTEGPARSPYARRPHPSTLAYRRPGIITETRPGYDYSTVMFIELIRYRDFHGRPETPRISCDRVDRIDNSFLRRIGHADRVPYCGKRTMRQTTAERPKLPRTPGEIVREILRLRKLHGDQAALDPKMRSILERRLVQYDMKLEQFRRRKPKKKSTDSYTYEVTVDTNGSVYFGEDYQEARTTFNDYVAQLGQRGVHGRSNEVTLFRDGEILDERHLRGAFAGEPEEGHDDEAE